MREVRPRSDRHTFHSGHPPPDIECNFSECHDNLYVRQLRELCFEMRLTRVNFFKRRLVIGRRASDGRCNVCVGQRKAIIDRLRRGNTREAVLVHRGHEEIAGSAATITRKDSACSIRAVRRRCEPQNEHTRIRIAKSWNRLRPIRIAAERGALDVCDVSAIRTKALAFVARNDVAMNLAE